MSRPFFCADWAVFGTALADGSETWRREGIHLWAGPLGLHFYWAAPWKSRLGWCVPWGDKP